MFTVNSFYEPGNGAPTPEPGGIRDDLSRNVKITAWRWHREVIYDIMAVKIRISYEKPQELHTVIKLLQPIIKSCKAGKGKDGQHKKAYVELKI